MSNDIHETQSPQQNSGLVSNDFKKLLIPIALTLVVNFGISYFAAQRSQDALILKTELNKEAIAVTDGKVQKLADAQTQTVIQMERMSGAMLRIAEDLKQLQQDQRNNNFQMNRQR